MPSRVWRSVPTRRAASSWPIQGSTAGTGALTACATSAIRACTAASRADASGTRPANKPLAVASGLLLFAGSAGADL